MSVYIVDLAMIKEGFLPRMYSKKEIVLQFSLNRNRTPATSREPLPSFVTLRAEPVRNESVRGYHLQISWSI